MGTRIVWSPEALEDVDSIAAYIAKDSPYYASAVVRKILSVARGLDALPKMGRVVPEMSDASFRERFVYSYRLIYRVQKKEIMIVAVIHGKRLLESMAERFQNDDSGE